MNYVHTRFNGEHIDARVARPLHELCECRALLLSGGYGQDHYSV